MQAREPGCGVAAHQQPRNARKLTLLGLNPFPSYFPFFHTATESYWRLTPITLANTVLPDLAPVKGCFRDDRT